MSTATDLLRQWNQGDAVSRDRLVALLYAELRSVAGRALAISPNAERLQPTELVNEVVLKLFAINQPNWQDRAQFLGIAAHAMRQVLVDQYRRTQSNKRAHQRATLPTNTLLGIELDTDLILVDDALEALRKAAPELVQVVEMKFFAGMTNPEIAHVLDLSESTIKRHWRAARAFLITELTES